MLVNCLRDGLTCNEKVYARGDVFMLSEKLHDEYGGLTPSQIARKQKDIYGFELFRPATEEEMWKAYQESDSKNEFMGKLESAERHIVGRFLDSVAEKIKVAAEAMSPVKEEKEEKKEVEPAVQESSHVEVRTLPKTKRKRKSVSKK